MAFHAEKTLIPDLLFITPDIFEDSRGFFMETYRKDKYAELGLDADFVQDNHSRSVKNVVRGLHFQWDPVMSKLIRVTHGVAFLVAVDIRVGSPSFGKWIGLESSPQNRKQLFAPIGCATGFCVLSDSAEVQYKCTSTYNPKGESGILWNDPAIKIDWPVKHPILSPKDEKAQTLQQWMQKPESRYFTFEYQESFQ